MASEVVVAFGRIVEKGKSQLIFDILITIHFGSMGTWKKNPRDTTKCR